jgi:hypothetical protein
MNAISGTILVILLVLVTLAPRRWALLGMMAGVFFLTQGHALDLAGLNLFPLRFLEATLFARVVLRRELVWSELNRIDWALLLTYNYTALIWLTASQEVTPQKFAFALDPTLCYLGLRGLITSLQDLRWLSFAFLPLLAVFTVLVGMERVTGQSSFTLVGMTYDLYERDGVPRAMGAFRHPSLLGSVAAALLAIYVGLWWSSRKLALAGSALCAILVLLTNSGGPVTSALAVGLGWGIWPLRTRMRLVRRAIVGILLILILFMEASIWFLPFKISQFVGGGGYHRGQLMESAWHDIGRWWLVGMDLRETVAWLPYAHGETGGADITNEFVAIAIKGGLVGLVLLILVLFRAFAGIGRRLQVFRGYGHSERANEAFLWGLGVAVFVHVVSWLGIAYFDQSWVIWLLHIAVASACMRSVEPLQNPQIVPEVPRRLGVRRSAPAIGSVAAASMSGPQPRSRFARSSALFQEPPAK